MIFPALCYCPIHPFQKLWVYPVWWHAIHVRRPLYRQADGCKTGIFYQFKLAGLHGMAPCAFLRRVERQGYVQRTGKVAVGAVNTYSWGFTLRPAYRHNAETTQEKQEGDGAELHDLKLASNSMTTKRLPASTISNNGDHPYLSGE